MLKILERINKHHLWSESGFSFFVRKMCILNFRETYLLPTLILKDNWYWEEPVKTIVIELRWWHWQAGMEWIGGKEEE